MYTVNGNLLQFLLITNGPFSAFWLLLIVNLILYVLHSLNSIFSLYFYLNLFINREKILQVLNDYKYITSIQYQRSDRTYIQTLYTRVLYWKISIHL